MCMSLLCICPSVCISYCMYVRLYRYISVRISPLYISSSVYMSRRIYIHVYVFVCMSHLCVCLTVSISYCMYARPCGCISVRISPSCISFPVFMSRRVYIRVYVFTRMSPSYICTLHPIYTLNTPLFVHSTLCLPHLIYTPSCIHFTFYTLHSFYTLFCVHSTLCILYPLYTLPYVHSTLCIFIYMSRRLYICSVCMFISFLSPINIIRNYFVVRLLLKLQISLQIWFHD